MAILHAGNSTEGDDLPVIPPYNRFRGALVQVSPWAPAAIASKTSVTTTVAVTDAEIGSPVSVGFSKAVAGIIFHGQVTASQVVTVTAFNATGGPVTLTPGDLSLLVFLL